jgi:hypothetical protein
LDGNILDTDIGIDGFSDQIFRKDRNSFGVGFSCILLKVFVCKSHYIDCLIKELGIDTLVGNPIYTPTTLTKEEILDNHRSPILTADRRHVNKFERGFVEHLADPAI